MDILPYGESVSNWFFYLLFAAEDIRMDTAVEEKLETQENKEKV